MPEEGVSLLQWCVFICAPFHLEMQACVSGPVKVLEVCGFSFFNVPVGVVSSSRVWGHSLVNSKVGRRRMLRGVSCVRRDTVGCSVFPQLVVAG